MVRRISLCLRYTLHTRIFIVFISAISIYKITTAFLSVDGLGLRSGVGGWLVYV